MVSPTLYANNGDKFPAVKQPEDAQVFRRAFTRGKDWRDFSSKPSEPRLMQLCNEIRRSENGRYFWGVLQMFGDLNAANRFLLSKFWQEQFTKLGASSARSEDRRDVVARTVVKRFPAKTIDLSEQSDLDRVSNIILQQAEDFRTFVPTLSWTELEKAFKRKRNEDWTKNPPAEDILPAEKTEMYEHELEGFSASVKWLCMNGILHQGYEHRCRKCLHRSWIAIDAVKRQFICEVCRTAEAAPVGEPWQFRLNEFVREALRKHGILPIFWTLSRLREMTEQSFYFEGPMDIWFETNPYEADGPDSDLDLVCVSNGKVSICEVKQSARQLRKATQFSGTINRLRPDVGVIAVMEAESAAITRNFQEFARNLATHIEPKLITLRENDDFDWFGTP